MFGKGVSSFVSFAYVAIVCLCFQPVTEFGVTNTGLRLIGFQEVEIENAEAEE